MSNAIEIAEKLILQPAELSESKLQKVLGSVLGHAVDTAELYFQVVYSESWGLEDGIVKSGSYDIDQGVGVRAIAGEKTGFAYSDDTVLPALVHAAEAAGSIAKLGGDHQVKIAQPSSGNQLYPAINPLNSLERAEKIAILEKIDQIARAADPRIIQVNASLSGSYEVMLVTNSNGRLAADVRPMVRCNVSVIAEQNGRREQGYAGGGGRFDFRYLIDENKAEEYATEAVRQALVNLEAVPAPAGTMPVVLANGWTGVLLHEAIGHGLEGDHIRKGLSAFCGRVGERVAAPGVTVVDDGTMEGRRGSLNIDDEGNTTQCTTLIEDGILKGFMQDELNAKLMNEKSTGNGRRESYAHIPMPRMTNTYMLAGQYEPEEVIASVDKGIYAVNFSGGQVDITSGKFVFSASEAYLIENGKVTRPIKGATLIGNGPDVLTKMSMIANDLELDTGIGICGKEGQSVPVGVGQPTCKIDEMTVGGTG